MTSGLGYRVASVAGTAVLSVLTVLVANLEGLQELVTALPVLDRLPATTLSPDVLSIAAGTVLLVQLSALAPLFVPRPRKRFDALALAQKRVLVATFVLATVGYFDYTYRLPRTTLVLTTILSLVVLPAWFVTLTGRRSEKGKRSVIVAGNDPDRIATTAQQMDDVEGYVAPGPIDDSRDRSTAVTDGGWQVADTDDVERLGGLSRLDEVLVDHDVDTAVLAFSRTDRGEFFGALESCYDHGIAAKVHRDQANSVLTPGRNSGEFVRVRLHPLDWQDHLVKRGFDVAFSLTALLALLPVVLLVTVAIRLDDGGPILFRQQRSAALGQTFTVYKFRTMREAPPSEDPTDDDENWRVTRVGRVLRKTHLDEIPQLWSILVGEMSVVGPRAAWTDEESVLESDVPSWRKRWFVKPGLTGLAQVNEATSTEPRRKLQYDVEYIRRQSFWFDCRIVARQIWGVVVDVADLLWSDGSTADGGASDQK